MNGINILIVDDDQMIVRGLQGIINRMGLDGVKTMTSYNAPDALEVLKYEGADLLITDVEMPIMNGLQLIGEALKREYRGKFIILSGFDSFDFVRQALRYQVADYLLKPVDKAELHRLVQKFYDELHRAPAPDEQAVDTLPELDIYNEPETEGVPERFAAVLAFIRGHFTKSLSLEKLSERFGLHPNYLCSLFQQYVRTTFHRYLEDLRLRKGVALLLNERDAPVAGIAEACGFMNERQFYKVFKKRAGTTPGTFRKQHEGIRLRERSEL